MSGDKEAELLVDIDAGLWVNTETGEVLEWPEGLAVAERFAWAAEGLLDANAAVKAWEQRAIMCKIALAGILKAEERRSLTVKPAGGGQPVKAGYKTRTNRKATAERLREVYRAHEIPAEHAEAVIKAAAATLDLETLAEAVFTDELLAEIVEEKTSEWIEARRAAPAPPRIERRVSK